MASIVKVSFDEFDVRVVLSSATNACHFLCYMKTRGDVRAVSYHALPLGLVDITRNREERAEAERLWREYAANYNPDMSEAI
jgi:hypothetical protein